MSPTGAQHAPREWELALVGVRALDAAGVSRRVAREGAGMWGGLAPRGEIANQIEQAERVCLQVGARLDPDLAVELTESFREWSARARESIQRRVRARGVWVEGALSRRQAVAWAEAGEDEELHSGVLVEALAGSDDLVEHESRVSAALNESLPAEARAYFPLWVEQRVGESGRAAHLGEVAAEAQELVSLREVLELAPEGLDPRDVAWMYRRGLVGIGALARAGWVHGNLTPENVLIHPQEHGLVLTGLHGAVRAGRRARVMEERWETLYPREVLAGKALSARTDLVMLGELMLGMMNEVPRELRAFQEGCRITHEPDAWALLHDLDAILHRVWGKRRFRPLALGVREGVVEGA